MNKKIFISLAILMGCTSPSYADMPVLDDRFAPNQYTVRLTVNDYVRQLEYRIEELERKVSGMQKQITTLHSKKADKN